MEPTPLSDSFKENATPSQTETAAAPATAVTVDEGTLHAAVKDADYNKARALVQAGANVNEINARHETPLTLALSNHDVRMTRLLLRAGADVAPYERMTGTSLLVTLQPATTAARKEEEALACLLLDHGAAANVRDKYGCPMVIRYAESGMMRALESLLAAGADPNATGDRDYPSALSHAVSDERWSVPMIRALLDAGADPNRDTTERNAPLLQALRQKNLAAAEALLVGGADPNRIDAVTATTPLLAALRNNDAAMVDLLLTHGADIHAPVRNGWRTLEMLLLDAVDSIPAIEKALLAGARADTCYLDENGAPVESALHLAVRQKRLEIVNLMLKHGADPLCVDGSGYTPLQLAHSLFGAENAIVDRLRLADGAARIERERAARAAAVETPPALPPRPPQKPPTP